MRQNLLLLAVGSIIGIASGLFIGRSVLSDYFNNQPEGAGYESVEEFRAAIKKRDKRDIKSDKSVSLRSIIDPHPSDLVMYTLKPNLDVKFQGVRLRTNAFGLRGSEVSLKKPENTYRIALLGDSFAFGWGVEEEKTFARVIEHELNRLSNSGKQIELLNFGVPGYSTFQEVTRFEEVGFEFEPDAILVFYVDNDKGLPNFLKHPDSDKQSSLLPVPKFVKQLHTGSTERRKELKSMLHTIHPDRWLHKLQKQADEKGIKLFLTINPRRGWKADYDTLRVLKEPFSIPFINIRDEFVAEVKEKKLGSKELSLRGDPHPSALRHRIYGGILARKLVNYIN